jgi:cysteine desulfurase / selenocysteine lyase
MDSLTDFIANPDAFPVLRKWNFFNHAGVSPLPRAATDAMRKWAQQAEEGAYLGTSWYADIEKLRANCAKLIHAHRDEIAFVKNTSEGLSIVARGIDWQYGDVIVTSSVEYPANVYPWMEIARTSGAKLMMAKEHDDSHGRRSVPIDKILEAASDPKCKMIALSHVEFASGQRHDLTRIGAFCRERDILFCVDAIQTLGVLPVDVQAMNIDYLSADGHKWMLGPEGAGFFYCRRDRIERTRPLMVGWMNVIDAMNYGDYNYRLKSDAGRFECGTYNVPGLLGFHASLDLLLSVGIDTISQRIKLLTDHLIERLIDKGYQIISPREADAWSGIVSFTSPKHELKPIVEMLRKQKQTEIAFREGRLRASPHFYNTEEQMDRLVEALPGHG